MIEGLAAIGRSLLERDPNPYRLLTAMIQEPPYPKNGDGQPLIAVFRFDFDPKTTSGLNLNVDIAEVNSDRYPESRILWIGNARKSNSPQDRLTTNQLDYLVSQTIPNLLWALDPSSELWSILSRLADKLYLDLGEPTEIGLSRNAAKNYKRYRRLWNLASLGIPTAPTLAELQAQARSNLKKVPSLVSQALREAFSLPHNQAMLYSIQVGDLFLPEHPDYRNYLLKSLVDDVFAEHGTTGVCHLSGERGGVVADLTGLNFKYYINDKLGFAPGFSGSRFDRAFSLSRSSYEQLLAGETFTTRHLRLTIARTNCYVIPRMFESAPQGWDIEVAWTMKEVRSTVADYFERPPAFHEKLEEVVPNESDESFRGVIVDLLFYERNRSEMRIIDVIRQVKTSRLHFLVDQLHLAATYGQRLYGATSPWRLTLSGLFYLFPVPKSQNKLETRELIRFYKRLIEGGTFEARYLIHRFLDVVRIYRFQKYESFAHSRPADGDEDRAIAVHLLRSVLVLLYLRQIGQLNWGDSMSSDFMSVLDVYGVREQERSFISEVLNDQPRAAACFLLGAVVGFIASAQAKQSDWDPKAKTILNKINYQGMSTARVLQLVSQLHEKIRQYLTRNRGAYTVASRCLAAAQELLERFRDHELSPAEHVYYILLGSSYVQFRGSKGQANDEFERNYETLVELTDKLDDIGEGSEHGGDES